MSLHDVPIALSAMGLEELPEALTPKQIAVLLASEAGEQVAHGGDGKSVALSVLRNIRMGDAAAVWQQVIEKAVAAGELQAIDR